MPTVSGKRTTSGKDPKRPYSISLDPTVAEAAKALGVARGFGSFSEFVEHSLEKELEGSIAAVKPEYVVPAINFDYTRIIQESRLLWLVLNDATMWLRNHEHCTALRDRMSTNRHTRFLMCHPYSRLVDHIAEISGKLDMIDGENRQTRNAIASVQRILEGQIKPSHNFKILGHHRFNTYTAVMNEDNCWVVYFPISKRYNDGVIHVYNRNGLPAEAFREINSDIRELERICLEAPDADMVALLGR